VAFSGTGAREPPVFKWVAAATAAVVAPPLALLFFVTGESAAGPADGAFAGGPTALARADIPPAYLVLYMDAAQTCPGLAWSVLAGIGKVESDHGRAQAPGVQSGANPAGAEGPMQFLPGTFEQYAVDGDHDGRLNVYDAADAIYTAAAMLCASGAAAGTPGGLSEAVFAYNHSQAYVGDVLSWAARYAAPAPAGAGSAAGAAGIAANAIGFAMAQLGKPYVWGATGPEAYDCSGLVYAAYASAGVRIARTTFGWRQDGPQVPFTSIEPGDLLFSAGSDGTPGNPGHVVMYLGGGQVIQAPQTGQTVQIDPLDLSGVVATTRPAALAASG
jgi:peptidoglycan DL-endopeptidase CwlO